MIILNFKNYPQYQDGNLDEILVQVQQTMKNMPDKADKLVIAPAIADLRYIKNKFSDLNVIAPHVDIHAAGPFTGWTVATHLVALGLEHSLLNHSEHRVWSDQIGEYVQSVQTRGLKLIVCCENIHEAKFLLDFQPYAIAFEDRELIGSGNSITTARQAETEEFINLVKGKSLAIIGAGVAGASDIKAAMKMGADGVLLASAFAKAENKVKFLSEVMGALE